MNIKQQIKTAFDFYLNNSIHVALSVVFITLLTFDTQHIKPNYVLLCFIFCSSIFGYNFSKRRIKKAIILNTVCFLISIFSLCYLPFNVQKISLFTFVILFFYTYPTRFNLRKIPYTKIVIVAFCWILTSILMPVITERLPDQKVMLYAFSFFVWIGILILPFDIRDIKTDGNIVTFPRKLGIQNTKNMGINITIILFFFNLYSEIHFAINFLFTTLISIFLGFSNTERSRYYYTFWGESIPIFIGLVYFLLNKF